MHKTPYHLGFYLFNKIEERYGLEECFIAREVCHDESFLRQYLTKEDCYELNLFSYSLYKRDYIIKWYTWGPRVLCANILT